MFALVCANEIKISLSVAHPRAHPGLPGMKQPNHPFFGADACDLFVGIAPKAGFAFGIDRKDHGGDVALAVVGGRVVDGWQHPAGTCGVLEIGGHAGLKFIISIIARATAGFLCVGVKINRPHR